MADDFVQVAPNSTGAKIDTESLTVGAETVERQRVQLAGAAATEIAVITDAAPADSDMGVVVRQVPGAAHDAAVSTPPTTIGGSASAAAPTSVSADGDAVLAWFLRNGAQAVVVTAGGALIPGDATDGMKVSPKVPAATTSAITAKLATDALQDGLTALTPKFAIIDAATSGDNTLLAAVASKKIRVLSLMLVAAGAVNVRFESGAGGTALSGQMNLVANTGFVLPFNPLGWFETASNTLLNLELSAAISVDGCFTYVEV